MFLRFLSDAADEKRVLVLLGDLFYYYFENRRRTIKRFSWLTDALAENARRWHSIVLLRGNRDFLLGETNVLPRDLLVAGDYLLMNLPSRRALITHGDLFLKGSHGYYAFRRFMRSGASRAFTRNISPALGVKLADGLRWISFRANSGRPFEPPDLEKIQKAADEFRSDTVIFGHFHKTLEPSFFAPQKPDVWCVGAWESGDAPVLECTNGEYALRCATDFTIQK